MKVRCIRMHYSFRKFGIQIGDVFTYNARHRYVINESAKMRDMLIGNTVREHKYNMGAWYFWKYFKNEALINEQSR